MSSFKNIIKYDENEEITYTNSCFVNFLNFYLRLKVIRPLPIRIQLSKKLNKLFFL